MTLSQADHSHSRRLLHRIELSLSSRTTPSGMPSRICSFCSSLLISRTSCKYSEETYTPANRSRVRWANARKGLAATTTSWDSAARASSCSAFSRESQTRRILDFSVKPTYSATVNFEPRSLSLLT